MGGLSLFHYIVVFIYIAILVIPVVKILNKAGFSGWWSILAIIPIVNLVALWILAFVKWPLRQTA